MDKNGIITTVAGNGNAGFLGDGGPATSAELNYPGGLVVDQNGDIYLGDPNNNRVRKISNGTISTVAGNGTAGFADGSPSSAEFNQPFGVAIGTTGNLYVADIKNYRIREISGVTTAATPQFTAAGVTNGASFQTGISAGALITIFGANLSSNVHGIAAFGQVPLPTSLGGAQVLINGKPIPLFDVININGTEQISAQAPFEIAGEQSVDIVVKNGRAQSASVQVPTAEAQPGIFLPDGVDGAFLHADYSLVTTTKPAQPGELVLLYCTGLGAVTPAGVTGAVASSTTLSTTNIKPTLSVGGANADVSFNGLAPALVGLYQINFTVPMGTPPGKASVVVTSNGVASNTANLPVQ